MADKEKEGASWRVVLLSLCIACTFHSLAVEAQTVPAPSGLVTWWQAEGNASDRIGSNNGYLTTGTSFVAGKVGQAFSFDSRNEGVVVGNPAVLQLQNLTIEAWVKRASPTIATLDNANGEGFIFGYDTGGYAFALLYDGQLELSKVRFDVVRSGALRVTDTNWHHIAMTKSGTTVVFYVDGASTTISNYGSGFTFGTQAAIGTGPGLVQSFYGSIDEVSIYNRPLSATEIQAIAAAPGGKVLADTVPATQAQTVPAPSGMMAWWQGEGNANDRIGSSNGTLIAGTSFVTGKVGQAFSFDSSPEGVLVGNPAALQLQNLTIEAWVKRTNPAPGNATLERADWPGIIFGYGNGGYAFGLYPDGQLALSMVGVNVVLSGSLAVTDTNWHHVAMTKSGTTVVFYWDGASTTILNYSSVFTFGTQAAIGIVSASPTQSFYGSIDEMSVYNRALTAAEIQAIAAAPGGKVFAYTVTATAGTNGSISPSGAVVVNQGASQAFTITPNTGYRIADVVVDGSSVGAVGSYTFNNVTANHTISASFAINTYTLTATAGSNGAITPSGVNTVNYGASQTFTITPNAGYHVADVLVDGSSVGAVGSYSLANIAANHTISASFTADSYAITASAGANGSISPLGTTLVNANGSQAFTIIPNAGYHVADVLVDGVSVGAVSSYSFSNVMAGHTISASFAINTYTITSSVVGANGSISPSGATTVNYGADQQVDITPATGYHIADVVVDNVSVGTVPSYTFTGITADHTISASFAINTYTITASAGAGGSISPLGAVPVNYDGTQAFVITPTTGFDVAEVLVDGVSVGAVSSYPFANVVTNHTIAVSFADKTPPVVVAPAAVSVEATGLLTTVAIGTASATDGVGVVSLTSNAPASYPLGSITVIWTAKDAAGNTGTATQLVTVKDTTAPLVTAPAAITIEATGLQTTVALVTATATDLVGVVSLSSNAPATFPVGTTTVTWTAKDLAGNIGTATQQVLVRDTTAPVVTAALTAISRDRDEDEDEDGNFYRITATATDAVDPHPVVSALITQPLTPSPTLVVSYKREKKNRIQIKMEKRKLQVQLSGPSEVALRTLWTQALLDGGFGVSDGQAVQLIVQKDKKDEYEAQYQFDKALKLTSAKGPGLKLVVWARDAAGNQSARVEVVPGKRARSDREGGEGDGRRDAKVVGEGNLPGSFGLEPNYPNPFNPSTTIPYVLAEAGLVKLSVYNVLGQQIRVLMDELQVTGAYTVSWDGLDAAGQQVAGGVYFYRLEAGTQHAVGRMLLLR